MSTKPRRTSEFLESSVKKPRVSRIAQPIRRPSVDAPPSSKFKRATSVDHHPPPTTAFGSSIKRARSTTPLRTPLNRKTPQKTPLSTCEKSKAPIDKEWFQTQAERINEYLKNKDLLRNGIKSISTKQFFVVVAHFIKLIAGNRFQITAENYVESISAALAELEYPYTCNRSFLKTPNTPHSYNQLIVLFSWLLDFVSEENVAEDFESADNLVLGDSFPDLESLKSFMTSTKEGFSLWNNKQMVEFEQLKQKQVDEFIFKKTGHKNLDQLQKRTQNHERELEQLTEAIKTLGKPAEEQEYHRLDEQQRALNEKCKKLSESCNQKQEQWKQLRTKIAEKEHKTRKLENQIQVLRSAIGKQKLTAKERDVCIEEIACLKHLLKTKHISNEEIQEISAQTQIQNSRVIRETSTARSKLSNVLCKVHAGLTDPAEVQFVDALKTNIEDNVFPSSDEDFKATIDRLSEIKRNHLRVNRQLTIKLDLLKGQLKENEQHNSHLDGKVQEARAKMVGIDEKLVEVNHKMLQIQEEGEQKLQQLKEQLKELMEMREKLDSDTENKRKMVEELEEAKQNLMQKYLGELEQKKEERSAMVMQMRSAVERTENLMNDVEKLFE